jgi:hypothetical protein
MTSIVFANGALHDGTNPVRREDHHVPVEGDRIKVVSDRPIKSATAETIDLRRTLMPGLSTRMVILTRGIRALCHDRLVTWV